MDIDFPSMVAEVLSAYGYTEAQLAKVLEVSQPTVHRIKTGEVKDPGFATGRRIVEIHALRPSPLPKPHPDMAGRKAGTRALSN
jgi:DNA-binding XRE family transcriptional regulator